MLQPTYNCLVVTPCEYEMVHLSKNLFFLPFFPVQSPRIPSGSRSGLLKCFVRREASTPRGDAPGRRIFMFLGKDPQNLPKARFLLAAVPRGRHQVFIYLNSKCEGTPCARLTSNFMCNSYTLTLEDGMSYLLEPPAAPAVPSIASEAGTSGFLDHTQRAGKNLSNAALTRSDLRDDEISVLDGENTSVVGEQAPIPGSKLLPQLLLSLKYRARIRGLMQPRRMEAILPNPEQVRCRGTLPWLQYGSGGEQRRGGGNLPTGSGSGNGNFSNGNGLHPSPAGPGHHRMGRRPSLTTISAVAALELIPSAVLNNNSNSIASGSGGDPGASGSGSGTSAATTPPTLAPLTIPSDGGNAGPSTSFSSPGTSFGSSSGYNSSVPSPEAPAVVGESSNTTSDDATRTGGQAPSGTAPGSPPPPEGHAVAPSQAAWRRALRLRLLRQPRVAADTVDESALPVGLRNKDPHWNEALRCWCLNFRGRVKLASVKNFQLVKDRDEDTRPVMQFGKVERNSFILDFNPTGKFN